MPAYYIVEEPEFSEMNFPNNWMVQKYLSLVLLKVSIDLWKKTRLSKTVVGTHPVFRPLLIMYITLLCLLQKLAAKIV